MTTNPTESVHQRPPAHAANPGLVVTSQVVRS